MAPPDGIYILQHTAVRAECKNPRKRGDIIEARGPYVVQHIMFQPVNVVSSRHASSPARLASAMVGQALPLSDDNKRLESEARKWNDSRCAARYPFSGASIVTGMGVVAE
jgi:hypothetical protein